MLSSVRMLAIALAVLTGLSAAAPVAWAVDEDRIRQLEQQMLEMQKELAALKAEQQKEQQEAARRTNILVQEFENLRTSLTVPAEPTLLEGVGGLGAAASKVYQVERGFSLAGYGEAYYRKDVGDKTRSDTDTADFLRFVLYPGYKFSDWLVMSAELEFEHASTSTGGSVSVEFAYLDFLLSEKFDIPLNVRMGMLLLPLGIVNEVHEPVFYHGIERPELERRIIPSTWRENGLGIWGELTPQLEYRLYAVNGLDGEDFKDDGFRSGRQKGGEARAEDIAVAGRLDYRPLQSLTLSASVYHGNSGQDREFTIPDPTVPGGERKDELDLSTTIWEVHGIYRSAGLEMRGLFAMSHLGDAADLSRAKNRSVAQNMLGGYFELAYDILPWLYPETEMSLSPFFRFSYLDLQHTMPAGFAAKGNRKYRIWTPGLSFKPHPQVVLKADYRHFNPIQGKRAQEVNFGMGFVF